jgi:hypothetical protein
MCLKDFLRALRREGIRVSEAQIRWAINSGKISRPPLDGSLRFDFGPRQLVELRRLLGNRKQEVSDETTAG